MKRILLTIFLILTATLFIEAGPASSATGTMAVPGNVNAYVAGLAANGVVRSRHNLGAFGKVLHTDATTQICVFCHTPHHSNTVTSTPLWNKSVANSTSYVAYGTTVAGTNVSNADLGGSTLACLSCHDGVSSFDSLVNAPGNGGVVAGGADQNWAFQMPQNNWFNPPANTFWDHFDKGNTGWSCKNCHEFSFGGENPSDRLSIGTDLTNDHPVSVTYSANSKASLRPKNTLLSAIDLTTGLSNTSSLSAYYQAMTQNRWAVKGSISDTAHISDLLRNDKVECSSCHDPHFRNLSWDEAESTWNKPPNLPPGNYYWYCTPGEDCSDGLFLRRVGGNTGSGVCRTCHDK